MINDGRQEDEDGQIQMRLLPSWKAAGAAERLDRTMFFFSRSRPSRRPSRPWRNGSVIEAVLSYIIYINISYVIVA